MQKKQEFNSLQTSSSNGRTTKTAEYFGIFYERSSSFFEGMQKKSSINLKSAIIDGTYYEINETSIDANPENNDNKIICDCFPNPFNLETTVNLHINRVTHLQIAIFDIKGKLIQILTKATLSPGMYSFRWDGMGFNKNVCPSGIYFVRIKSDYCSTVKKVTMLK